MIFCPGFEEATLNFYDKPDAIYYIWHPYQKQNGERGNRVGAVHNHYYLMEILSRINFDIYDEHLSIYRFIRTRPAKNSVTGIMPETSTAVINKLYFDIDPPDEVKNTDKIYSWQHDKFDQLQKFRKLIPSRIYATGRGYLVIIDLFDHISIKEASELQTKINAKYNLGTDKHVPISVLRVFKLPYTKNSKTNTWVLPVLSENTYSEIFRMQRYEELTGKARWLNKDELTVNNILEFIGS